MTQTMHIVAIKDTGHILAAVAQTITAGDPKPEALVGRDLPVQNVRDATTAAPATWSLLPVEVLEVKAVPFDAAVVANPQNHAVNGGRVEVLPPLPAALPDAPLNALTVTLNGGTVDTKGLAVVARQGEPDTDRRVQSGKFVLPAGAALVLPLTIIPDDTPAGIPSGDYDVLVALAGQRPFRLIKNVP